MNSNGVPCACRFEERDIPDLSGEPPKLLDRCGFHQARAKDYMLAISEIERLRKLLFHAESRGKRMAIKDQDYTGGVQGSGMAGNFSAPNGCAGNSGAGYGGPRTNRRFAEQLLYELEKRKDEMEQEIFVLAAQIDGLRELLGKF